MSKQRVTEIATILQASPATEARLAVEMVQLLVESSREALVNAGPTEVFVLQGKAQAYDRLLKMLTERSPVAKP